MLINGEEIKTTYPHRHPLYSTWWGIKTRCYNPNHECYYLYGAVGVTVCDAWKDSFEEFYKWAMENHWVKGLVVDRIDPSKSYSPENCQLITDKLNQLKKYYQIFFLPSGEFNKIAHDEFSIKCRRRKNKEGLVI